MKFFLERKIFSIVWLCFGKYARKWFLMFGLHIKWLLENMYNPANSRTVLVVWLCFGKYVGKWFPMFGLHVKWLSNNMYNPANSRTVSRLETLSLSSGGWSEV